MKLFAVAWKYWIIVLLYHLPTRRMVSGSTRAMRRAMPPPYTEGACADFRLGETDIRSCCSNNGSDVGRDVFLSDMLPLGTFLVS